MHDLGLIGMLAAAFSAALILGYATQRLGLSPILGFLLAGVAVGPHTPGFVADAKIASQLAEVGVILLMFGVGLHFHVKDLLAVKSIAIPGAIGQSLVATALGAGVAWGAGWSLAAGVVLGIAISVASTVVLMRVLVDNDALDTPQGHIAVGWLIVEDIFTVLVLVLLPVAATSLASGAGDATAILKSVGWSFLSLAALATLVLVAGSRVIPWLLTRVARTRSRELFTLSVLVLALAIAAGSYAVFGASMALGAFLAGMVVGQTKVSDQAALGLELLPAEGYSLLVACALISIALNPLLFRMSGRFESVLRARPRIWGILNRRAEARGLAKNAESQERLKGDDGSARAVVIGYGPVGQTAVRILSSFGIKTVAIDLNVDTVSRIAETGGLAIYGDAARENILKAAGADRARYLVITLPDLATRSSVIQAARRMNPQLKIMSRARYLGERQALSELGVDAVVYEEVEAAVGLTELLLRAEGTAEESIDAETRRIRAEFAPRRSSVT